MGRRNACEKRDSAVASSDSQGEQQYEEQERSEPPEEADHVVAAATAAGVLPREARAGRTAAIKTTL